jgi:YVTN family beta-propeller protein
MVLADEPIGSAVDLPIAATAAIRDVDLDRVAEDVARRIRAIGVILHHPTNQSPGFGIGRSCMNTLSFGLSVIRTRATEEKTMAARVLGTTLILWLFCSSALALDGTLLVSNRSGGSISFIDLTTGVEIARIPIGPIIPHEVAVSPDGRLALTAEYGPNSDPGRRVILIDVATASVVGRIDLGPDSRPHTARFLPDGQHAVATMQDSDQVALLELGSMQVVRKYPTGGREGHMVRLSPDGSRAYVTSRGAAGTLSVIFLNEERAPVVIETGEGAEGISVTPDGSEVWVANRRVESISIIDTESLEVVATLGSRPFAGRIEMSLDGRAIVPNGTSSEQVPQYLRVFDVESREMLSEVPLRDGQPQAGNFGVLIHDGVAFVSDPRAGTIQTFDLDTMNATMNERTVLVANHEAPDGMAWTPVRVSVMTQP